MKVEPRVPSPTPTALGPLPLPPCGRGREGTESFLTLVLWCAIYPVTLPTGVPLMTVGSGGAGAGLRVGHDVCHTPGGPGEDPGALRPPRRTARTKVPGTHCKRSTKGLNLRVAGAAQRSTASFTAGTPRRAAPAPAYFPFGGRVPPLALLPLARRQEAGFRRAGRAGVSLPVKILTIFQGLAGNIYAGFRGRAGLCI